MRNRVEFAKALQIRAWRSKISACRSSLLPFFGSKISSSPDGSAKGNHSRRLAVFT